MMQDEDFKNHFQFDFRYEKYDERDLNAINLDCKTLVMKLFVDSD